MNKKYRYIRTGIAVIVGFLSVLAFVGLFYPIKIFDIQAVALFQRILIDFSLCAGILSFVLLVITLLFGRIYCSTLCPLGLYQELLTFVFHRKISEQKNKPYKYFLTAIVFGSLIGGTAILIRLTDPYSLFGSAMSGAWPGLAALGLITGLVWFKGRLFCSNICPVGTLLGLISKHAVNKIYIKQDTCISCGLCASKCPTGSIDFKNKTVNNETCVKCFKCMSNCRKNSLCYGTKPAEAPLFSPARRRLLVGGAVVAVFALAVKSSIELSKNATTKIKKIILPAGAEKAEDFANRCLNCNLCVQNCPMKIIKKANGDYNTVHIDYENSFCDYNCNKCAQVCPSGAIKRITLAEKQKMQIALAVIDEDACIKCGLCVMKCPREAITKENNDVPHIDTNSCIGCGACKNTCPVKAITIIPVEKQKIL